MIKIPARPASSVGSLPQNSRKPFAAPVISIALALWGLSLGAISPARGQTGTPSEYQVKAAFLYNFAKFVQWPADAFRSSQSPLVLGVLGRNPFGSILKQTLQGKTAQGRSFMIRTATDPKEIGFCHILFISASEQRRLGQILKGLQGPVLTVSEIPRFAHQGGIINFYLADKKVRFEINLKKAEKVRIKIKSQLLRHAKIVKVG